MCLFDKLDCYYTIAVEEGVVDYFYRIAKENGFTSLLYDPRCKTKENVDSYIDYLAKMHQ